MRSRLLRGLVGCATVLMLLGDSRAASKVGHTLSDLVRGSARIFRGRCVKADVGTIVVAGAHIDVTAYSFEAGEHLKGSGPDLVVFRQVGRPQGGPLDLGERAGLPVYTPGVEYLLFLLPESQAGLTSPAGASGGTFIVDRDQVRVADPGILAELTKRPGAAAAGQSALPFDALRRAVMAEVRR